MPHRISRRRLLKTAAVTGLGLSGLQPALTWGAPSAREKLSFACIGMGGQMRGYLIPELAKLDQQIVAICDVDQRQLDSARQVKGLSQARVYRDYRELLEREKTVDAVIIATPDHWHVPICLAALQQGKHVYCEKPLAHSVAECRALEAMARSHPELATQTGNQGCSTEGFRRSYEVIQAGVLGDVTEVHVWHPGHAWPNGVDRPADSDPIPEGFDWKFWLGGAAERPYKYEIYHPGKWRGWYDFGGGSLADFCCHGFQLAFRALNLDAPTRISAVGSDLGHESFATRCTVTYEFAAKKDRGPVRLYFYSGENQLPPAEVTQGPVGTTGCLVVGTAGTLSAGLWNTDCNVRLNGEQTFRGADHPAVARLEKTQPRIDTEVLKWDPKKVAQGQRPKWSQVNNSHMFEWVLACAGDTKAYSPFEIGARITEVGMLGVLALRLQKPIVWDAEKRQAVGLPEANALIDPQPATKAYFTS
ncbi:MAG: Gfo/Idh/MocA family oxidoreductase [Planctomycetes bacterium]|nr:Gfo/Idh/MocA family oxidoreductase [Planctomycetota bacterium]